MVLGFGFFATQAMLSYRFFPFGKRANKILHGVWHSCAIIFISTGLVAVFKYHNYRNIANLYSMHSWFGIATLTLFFSQYVLGFLVYFFPGAHPTTRKAILPVHICIGVFAYISGIFTIESGITEKNEFLGCSYSLNKTDTDPAAYYMDIPAGCRVSGGLGLVLFFMCVCVVNAIIDIHPPPKRDPLLESFGDRA